MYRYRWETRLGARLEQTAERVRRLRQLRLPSLAEEALSHWLRIHHVYHSNAISGSRLTLPETRTILEDGPTFAGKPPKVQAEATHLSHALDFIESLASSRLPLTERDLRILHAVVLGTGESTEAGSYRTTAVPPRGPGHTPPDASLVPEQIQEFSAWLSQETAELPLVLASRAHAAFDAIHPFTGGNGRIGRLLLHLLLFRHGYPLTVLRVKDRARYHTALKQAHQGDITSLTTLLVESVEHGLARYEYAAQSFAEDSPPPSAALPPGDPREFPAWRRGVDALLDALETVALQLTAKHSGAVADLSLSVISLDGLTPVSWEQAHQGPLPLAVLCGQSSQGTYEATLTASCPREPRAWQRTLPALTLQAATVMPERPAEFSLEENALFTVASTTGQLRQGISAEKLATDIWTQALEGVLLVRSR
ncbi:Fic family protein [Stigmatella sp. ncwal1]|uniref:Fic family protein n=1 Tax=Stigmatella ashevillensis TaxID=2995309 RepID=A0ABT5DEF3_9BACT|nr:Fic family protein [Stigmatella ashevillena]MDC0712060.1 Fic family protein [Stigmatella ashevillena]